MKADLCAAFGWSWHDAGEITLEDLQNIQLYWSKLPPVNKAILAYMGVEIDKFNYFQEAKEDKRLEASSFDDVFSALQDFL